MRRSTAVNGFPRTILWLAALTGLLFTVHPAGAFQAEGDLHDYEIALTESPAAGALAPASVEEAWSRFAAETGGSWQAAWDQATATPRRIVGGGEAMVSQGMSASMVDRISRQFLAEHPEIFRVSQDDLFELAVREAKSVWFVIYGQTYEGLTVEGARVDLRFGRTGHLLLAGGYMHPEIEISTDPRLTSGEAARIAAGSLPAGWNPVVEGEPELKVLPLVSGSGYDYRLIYDLTLGVESPRARWQTFVDAHTGEIHFRTNHVRYADFTGAISGDIQETEPTDPYVELGHPHNRITFDGLGEFYADENGDYAVTPPNDDPRTVTIEIRGRWINTNRQDGADAQIVDTATPGIPFDVSWDDGNSHPAERDVYFHGTVSHDYIKNIDPGLVAADYAMPGNVNINSQCNAFWDGFGINFFRPGGGCANTGQIADVVMHEYGHGVTQWTYEPLGPPGPMHEGFSDYFANTITDQPLIGIGFYGPGTFLRTSDNDRTWPAPECGGGAHCLGEVIAGALWHMRENLIDELGDHDVAVELADDLWHFARYGGNNDFESYYYDLLVVDDDNGTLVDGTPHGISIVDAFDRHNIGPGFVLDILHEPLPDTEDDQNPYEIVATFSTFLPFGGTAPSILYQTTAGVGGFTEVAMTPTGEVREYSAEIPAQPYTTIVSYYISGTADSLGISETLPEGAPGETFDFTVGVDTTPPVIVHTPLGNRSMYEWPASVSAEVTDNLGVAEVVLEYRINAVDQTPVVLTEGEDDVYSGDFGGSVEVGDVVEYRIKATDGAGSPNTAFDPPAGYYVMNIVIDVRMSGENGAGGWTHAVVTDGYVDQWHLSTERNFTLGGQYSWKFGDTGNGPYADLADGALVTPPVMLGTNASLIFWDWIDAEVQNSSQAWDGAVVELSTDEGANWELIEPVGGYPYTIIDNPASPFPPGYPCFSGSHDWEMQEFDLGSFEDERVQIRFRFGSDGFGTEEGWHVDDIVLHPDEGPSDVSFSGGRPVATGLQGVTPNPFNPQTTIRLTVAEARSRVDLAVYDVSGRLVRRLMNGLVSSGAYSVTWDGRNDAGSDTPSGLYFVRLKTAEVEETLKMTLMK